PPLPCANPWHPTRATTGDFVFQATKIRPHQSPRGGSERPALLVALGAVGAGPQARRCVQPPLGRSLRQRPESAFILQSGLVLLYVSSSPFDPNWKSRQRFCCTAQRLPDVGGCRS